MQKAQVSDTVESLDHFRAPRVVQIEQQIAVGRKAVGEEHPARAELVLGVMRPESLFIDGRRGDDRSVAIALAGQIDDREEVAILAPLVADPGEEITRGRLISLIGGGKRRAQAGKRDDDGKGMGTATGLHNEIP